MSHHQHLDKRLLTADHILQTCGGITPFTMYCSTLEMLCKNQLGMAAIYYISKPICCSFLGSCLFMAGSLTNTVGSQNFLYSSNRLFGNGAADADFLLQCVGDMEADHTDSGIVMGCADRNRETPHLGD